MTKGRFGHQPDAGDEIWLTRARTNAGRWSKPREYVSKAWAKFLDTIKESGSSPDESPTGRIKVQGFSNEDRVRCQGTLSTMAREKMKVSDHGYKYKSTVVHEDEAIYYCFVKDE
jgi:hypothetical protein